MISYFFRMKLGSMPRRVNDPCAARIENHQGKHSAAHRPRQLIIRVYSLLFLLLMISYFIRIKLRSMPRRVDDPCAARMWKHQRKISHSAQTSSVVDQSI
jgi:hypothetical protein